MEYLVARLNFEQLKISDIKYYEMVFNFKVLKGDDQTNYGSDLLNFLVQMMINNDLQ